MKISGPVDSGYKPPSRPIPTVNAPVRPTLKTPVNPTVAMKRPVSPAHTTPMPREVTPMPVGNTARPGIKTAVNPRVNVGRAGGMKNGGKVQKYAAGGAVRGTGCATKGKKFSGVY